MTEGVAAAHWDNLYRGRRPDSLSWYEAEPARSLEWVRAVAPDLDSAILDVGAGDSRLVDRLTASGYSDVTVLDVASTPIEKVRSRLGPAAAEVHFVVADLLAWEPLRQYDVWHDRAVFHFLVSEEARTRYATVLRSAVPVGGHIVVATFAPSGPEQCSGLPTMRYDAESLVAALGPGLTTVRAESADHATPGGELQPFTWVALRRER